MPSNDHSNIDARGATFNNVGRDQVNVFLSFAAGPGAEQTLPLDALRSLGLGLPNNLVSCGTSRPTSNHDVRLSPRDFHSSANSLPAVTSAVDIAVGLIIQITSLLIDPVDPSNNRRDLELELKSLQQTLTLIRLAIQEYNARPLGRSLANTITPEVQRCSAVLSELFDNVNGTGLYLFHTSISDLWRPVWWSRWTDDEEVASLKMKLRDIRISLGGILSALNSVAWIDLENELHAGYVSLHKFHAILKRYLPSLGHIKVHAVQVVDHLGQSIRVPFTFCSRWEDFDHIVNGFCRNRPGNRYVEQGEYQLMNAEDSQIISRSEFASTVKPETALEMNIILRKDSAFKANKKKCPRPQCGYVNLTVTATQGWIECRMCFARFQAAEAAHTDETSDRRRGKAQVRSDNTRGKKYRRGGDGGDVENIISPASELSRSNTLRTINQTIRRLQNDDESRFFCRMHIIYRDHDGILKVFIEPPSDDVKSIKHFFSLVNSPESADLVIRRNRAGTLQYERLDPILSKYARLLDDIPSEPNLSDALMGVSHFNFHLSRGNAKQPLKKLIEVVLHRLTPSNPDQIYEDAIYMPDGDTGMLLDLDHENTVFAAGEEGEYYGLSVTNNSGHHLFPYLLYFNPYDYSIQLWYHSPAGGMPAPLPARRKDDGPSELKVGYGAANLEAFRLSLADGITADVGFLRLFVSTTYVDMTSLELLYPFAGGGRMNKPPRPLDTCDAWTYVLKTVRR